MDQSSSKKCNLWKTAWNGFRNLASFCLLDIALPVCVFVALYGKTLFDLSDSGVQYSIAFSIILASRRFMIAIAKFPVVGGKVYMLHKVICIVRIYLVVLLSPKTDNTHKYLHWSFQVMQSVLNFFGVYIFHFMGYAIAFHVLLPKTDDFKSIGDGTLKVNVGTEALITILVI